MVDYHLVMDLIPNVARIFFLKQLGDVSLSAAQCVSLALLVFVCQLMKQKKGRYHHQDIFQRLFFRAGREVLDLLSDASSPALMFQALLLGIGLQHKSVDQLEKEIELPSSQLMGLFNRLIRKFVQASPSSSQTTEKMLFLRIKKREKFSLFWPFRLQVFTSIQEKAIEAEMVATKDVCMEPTIRSLQEDLVSGLTHQHQDINELLKSCCL